MKFRKGISKENQQILTSQLKEYEQNIQMTKSEKRELHAWVAGGHSPYDNGDYIYDEDGYPMDFISASRFVNEAAEWFRNLSEAEQEEKLQTIRCGYDTQLDTPFIYADTLIPLSASDDEIPF